MTSFPRLFATICLPAACVLLMAFYFNYNITVGNANDRFYATMKEKWNLVSNIDLNDPASETAYEKLKKAGDSGGVRITIIAPSGTVLNDSALPYGQAASMNNHRTRDEIRNAYYGEPFYSVRKSLTTGNLTVYYAEKTENGSILRISSDGAYLEKIKSDALRNSGILFAAVLVISAAVSAYLARRLSEPIKRLKEFGDAVSSGSENYHPPIFRDEAVNEIAELIYKMHASLAAEKKSAETEREKLNSIFVSMDEGIILLTETGEIAHFNAQASEYLGLRLEKGMNVIKDMNDVETIMFFKQATEQDNAERRRVKFRDGIFELYVKRINGQILAVFKEVTDRIQYEAFKTELIGNIAHEIKTPLSLIMGASETILKDEAMPENIRSRFTETIYRNSGKLNSIINDILDLHRLESAGSSVTVRKPADVDEVIKDLDVLLNFNNGKKIICSSGGGKAGVRAEHLESVLANFINNAIKYSSGEKILVDIRRDNGRLKISVSDEGPLIPETDRKRIFERFYTVSKSRTRSYSGSGLGLAIVKHISELYGGKASVRENNMGGNTFEAILREKEMEEEY